MAASPEERIAQRYGSSRRPRWFWPLITAIGLSVGIAWAAWGALQPKPVTAVVWGYDVKSDTRTDVTIDVNRPDNDPVRCRVYVQAIDHSVVGEKSVDIGADEPIRQRVTVEVTTERRGVTGVLRTCEVSR